MVCGQYNSRELGFSIIHVVMLSFVLLLQILMKQRQREKKVEIQQMLHVCL